MRKISAAAAAFSFVGAGVDLCRLIEGQSDTIFGTRAGLVLWMCCFLFSGTVWLLRFGAESAP